MATSPYTVDPRVAIDPPAKRPESQFLAENLQELARLDQVKTSALDAIRLWLRWNAIHETLAKAMFDKRHDQREVERLLDESESLRRQAIQMSLECLLEQG